MQFFGQGKPAFGIIFDSDFGNSIDTALALAMLYGFESKSAVRVVSLSVSKSNLKAAAFCDAVARFYAQAIAGQFAGFLRGLPVGLSDAGKSPEETPILKASYTSNIHQLNDTAEVRALIRNAFTAQHDGNCAAVLAGPATDFAAVLDLPGVKDLIARKAKFLAAAVKTESDIAAAKKLFREWPGKIVIAPPELGEEIRYPAESIEKDFAWATAPHPVVEAYKAYRTMSYDAPTWAMAPALYAAKPEYFKLSEPGVATVDDSGRMRLMPVTGGRHFQIAPVDRDQVRKAYVDMASMKPIPRQFRFRSQQQQDEKKKDAKQ